MSAKLVGPNQVTLPTLEKHETSPHACMMKRNEVVGQLAERPISKKHEVSPIQALHKRDQIIEEVKQRAIDKETPLNEMKNNLEEITITVITRIVVVVFKAVVDILNIFIPEKKFVKTATKIARNPELNSILTHPK